MTTDDLKLDYQRRGMVGQQRFGTRPCLLVVDVQEGFTNDASPLGCNNDEAIAAIAELIRVAREVDVPVVYSKCEYDAGSVVAASAFIEKVPMLGTYTADSRWTKIDERVRPEPDEFVITKVFASVFAGTPLAQFLAASRCDSVVCVGTSTSGCVRATAVDALQHGYRVAVVSDAVFDRADGPHQAALFDLQAKYATVVDKAVAAQLLATFARERSER